VKPIAIVVLVVVTVVIVGHAVLAPPAPTVEQASAALATTERQLAVVVTKSTITSRDLDQGLDTPLGISQELQDFDRTTAGLERLLAELDKEIRAYDAARTEKMAAFNHELQAINSPATRRHVEHLRARASATTARRLTRSRSTLTALHALIERGADVQHAARCVQLAHDLDVQGSDLRAQVQFTRHQVVAYARLTTTLLANLTTPSQQTD
jgi:hypothetical protein